MNASSLLLTPSAQQRGGSVAASSPLSSSSPFLVDAVPCDAALQRLLSARVAAEEQLSSYSLQQAYRGLLYGVRAATLTLKGDAGQESAVSIAADAGAAVTDTSVLRGWQVVLYRMAVAATRSAAELECVVFLSTRILCDAASAHGEGNERPCCTREWTQALLRGLPLNVAVGGDASGAEMDVRFTRLTQANRRYQLGFLLILSNTLRMLATGRVDGQRLCAEHADLFAGVARDTVPSIARCVEASMRDGAQHGAAALPSRLTVSLNDLVVHSVYWLATDVLAAHVDAEADAAGAAANRPRPQRKRPLVLDRDQPSCLWECVALVRNALRRGLAWLGEEGRSGSVQPPSPPSTTALLSAVSQQLENVFVHILKHQELLQNALLNARREFGGASSQNTRTLTEAAYASTLQMCFLVRSITGVWVAVHGGLGLASTSADLVLSSSKDVLMLMASALLRVPTVEAATEAERGSFLATDATLSACLALVAAAPTAAMQAELWATDSNVTREIHALLVQRALRYRDERVLKLAALLSRAVLDAAASDGALAGFAADSSDQLLELLETEDDAASRCVGELLCVAILERPYRLIPALFRLLRHGSAAARRHVLELLSSLPDLISGTPSAQETVETAAAPPLPPPLGDAASASSDRRRNVLRLLAENLLLQLQDEELCVRLLSSSLFAKVHPDDVLVPLLNLCVQRDTSGRQQSAALSALTAVLTAHTDSAATYLLLLQCGYECHTAATAASASHTTSDGNVAISTTEAGEAGDERAPRRLPPPPPPGEVVLRRPTPQTPGDILSQALLYSADDAAAEAAPDTPEDAAAAPTGTRDATRGAAPRVRGASLEDADAPAADAHGGVGTQRRRAAQLHSALLTLTDRWVRAAACEWTRDQHSLPVFRFLAQQAGLDVVGSSAAVSVAEGAAGVCELRVQWAMKYALRLTATLTGLPTASSASLRVAHLSALWDTFFVDVTGASGSSRDAWSAVVHATAAGGAQTSSQLHAGLLPLLCLRSCAPGTFATAEEGETGRRRVEGADADVVHRLWRVLWRAVTLHGTSSTGFFAVYPDVQRVALEVLCRFPARRFFDAWSEWVSWRASTATPTCPATAAPAEHDGALSPPMLFGYRVYLFAVASYVATAGVATPAQRRRESQEMTAVEGLLNSREENDLQAVLDFRLPLERLVQTILPQWLMEEEDDAEQQQQQQQQGGPSTHDRAAEAMKQRLCAAAVDAAGVVGAAALSAATSPTDSHTGLESLSHNLLATPLSGVVQAYRNTESGSLTTAEMQRAGAREVETSWTAELTRLQLALRIHQCLLRTVSLHPTNAPELLLRWFGRYLRLLVELANAGCRSEIGRGEHGCRAAIYACGLVFQAVLLARKVDPVGAASGASATSDRSLLSRLGWEEREALVDFSVGCVRFAASAGVQSVGVRLLSAVLVAAPELFLDMEAARSSSATPRATVRISDATSAVADAQQRPLSSAASALQSIALMHTDRPTRVLAAEVTQMLAKAAAASATS
ncbi:hypothetical protein NESM_000133800 [Novymonas esmeraldas]|uniref:Uncharacterized protein n=1 Tax=Novymonas esmeraldas TaxID=1808958 RepID=A0AAW0F5P7_9TRYP